MIRIDDDGPVPGCLCEECEDEIDFQAWEAELSDVESV